VARLRVGRPVGVLLPWRVIAVAACWPMGTQPQLAARALTINKLSSIHVIYRFSEG